MNTDENTLANPNRERLPNGIVLPEIWPPNHFRPESTEPMPLPYLQNPPEIIPIDLGRQLFVDDFLIAGTTLERTFHHPQKYSNNPVFVPETPEEIGGGEGKKSVVFTGHGGLFFDREAGVFKLFYRAGWLGALALATSRDLFHWTRPDLGLAGGNVLLPKGPAYSGEALTTAGSDNSLWLDQDCEDPAQRIKFLTCWIHVPGPQIPKHTSHTLHVSDGITWSKGHPTGVRGDYCSFFYNPFRKVWVSSIRVTQGPRGRCRYYSEHEDFLKGADWSKAVYWTGADSLDRPEPEGSYPGAGTNPELYSLNAVAYESILIGMHAILRGPKNEVCDEGKFPKMIDLELGFSRDGFHWDRPDRSGFIRGERTEGAWDRAYVHSVTGVCVVLDDQLVFPYTAFSGVSDDGERGSYSGGRIGLAFLRRDGFASMDAGPTGGFLTTRPLCFSGHCLFINAAVGAGTLRVEIQDLDRKPIGPFTLQNSTIEPIRWEDGADLSALAGKPVRFHFELSTGSLYAFWVSKDGSGRSDGFVAAGGPGYTGMVDTLPDCRSDDDRRPPVACSPKSRRTPNTRA